MKRRVEVVDEPEIFLRHWEALGNLDLAMLFSHPEVRRQSVSNCLETLEYWHELLMETHAFYSDMDWDIPSTTMPEVNKGRCVIDQVDDAIRAIGNAHRWLKETSLELLIMESDLVDELYEDVMGAPVSPPEEPELYVVQ